MAPADHERRKLMAGEGLQLFARLSFSTARGYAGAIFQLN
jgi:hypothetical protein